MKLTAEQITIIDECLGEEYNSIGLNILHDELITIAKKRRYKIEVIRNILDDELKILHGKRVEKRYNEASEMLKDYYGANISGKDLKNAIGHDVRMEAELNDNTYDDTVIREELLDMASLHIVGIKWPKFGDTLIYKDEFKTKAKATKFIDKND